MSYGIGIYDSKGFLSLLDGWYPMAYKGTISFTVQYNSATDVSQNFDVPAGCFVVVQPAGPAVQHYASGSEYSGYVLGSFVNGGRVTIRQHLWYGFSNSPLVGTVVKFNIFAYYPSTASSGAYGALLSGSGVSVALTNATKLNVLRWKGEWNTGSSDFTFSTGIKTSEQPPSVYISDKGYNCIASYVFISGDYWHVRVIRRGGAYNNEGSTYISQAPATGLVRAAVFGSPPAGLPAYGMALYGSSGAVAFRSDYRPEMPRGFLGSPSPSVSVPPGGGWWEIADGNAQWIPNFGTIKPMIKARMIGISKLSFLPFPVATRIKSNGLFTCGVLDKGPGRIPIGSIFGYWGENSANSPIPYINEYDYF